MNAVNTAKQIVLPILYFYLGVTILRNLTFLQTEHSKLLTHKIRKISLHFGVIQKLLLLQYIGQTWYWF